MENNGYTFVMDKELYDKAQPVTIDMSYLGFQVNSNLELGGGGCASSCGSGGSCAC